MTRQKASFSAMSIEVWVLIVFGAVMGAVIALIWNGLSDDEYARELSFVAAGALAGLFGILLTWFLENMKARKQRLQEAQGLAIALAAEVGTFSTVLFFKGTTLRGNVGRRNADIDPNDLLRFIELQSRVIFDANAGKLHLLEVIEDGGDVMEPADKLVMGVIGFYEGIADLRTEVSAAKFQQRNVTQEEVKRIQGRLIKKANFAKKLEERLKASVALS